MQVVCCGDVGGGVMRDGGVGGEEGVWGGGGGCLEIGRRGGRKESERTEEGEGEEIKRDEKRMD